MLYCYAAWLSDAQLLSTARAVSEQWRIFMAPCHWALTQHALDVHGGSPDEQLHCMLRSEGGSPRNPVLSLS
jgi:hypothetical protein